MTCIVGIVDKGTVHLGGDSAATENQDITLVRNEKVFTSINPEIILGYAGSFRFGNIVRYLFSPPRILSDEPMEYMVRQFIPALKEVMTVEGIGKFQEKDIHDHENWLLVGVKGRLFGVEPDFAVIEESLPFSSIGSGKAVAWGSLCSTEHMGDPRARLELALKASSAFTTSVSPPFNFVKL